MLLKFELEGLSCIVVLPARGIEYEPKIGGTRHINIDQAFSGPAITRRVNVVKNIRLTLSIFACIKLVTSMTAAAAVELIKPAGAYHTAHDPIQIRLTEVPKAFWPYLLLELDDIDISQFISRFNDVLKYDPVEPLATGHHQLRLLAVTPDGNIEEIANWQLDVRTSAGFIESSIESNVDLQVLQRVADNFTLDTVGRTQGQGSAAIASHHATNSVRLTSSADFIYNSQRDQTLNGRKFDLNEFNLTSEWSQAAVSVGHQSVPANSLILADFNRRGVSATVGTESRSVTATAFGLRTETITGFEHGLGVGDSQHRTAGAVIRAAPLENAPEKLIVSAMYLDGRGQSEGQAEVTDDTPDTEGDASAIVLESYNIRQQLYLRGEYARTRFDFDGKNTGFGAEDDHASAVYVQFATERDQERAAASNWNLGLLRQRVGPWFHSLGNTYLPSDKELTQLNSAYASPSWQVTANAAFEQSNVEDDQAVPTIETRFVTTALTYTPQSAEPVATSGLFSNPTYTLGYTYGNQEQVTTPIGFVGDLTHLSNREATLSAGFAGDTWSWRLAYILSQEEDVTNLNSDRENRITSLEAYFPIGTQFSLTPVIQSTRSREVDSGTTIDGWNTGLTVNYHNLDDWSGGLTYTVSREDGNDGFTNSRVAVIELIATWVYQQSQENKPGIRLFTTASYQDTSSTDINADQYQVFIGVNVNWPVSF